MSGHAASLTCLISITFVLMVAGQHAVIDVGDPFDSFQDSFHGATRSRSSSDTEARTNRSSPTLKGGKGDFGGTSVVPGFGSKCSLEHQCNVLLGLACTSYGTRVSRCACAPSTPVHVNEGGVQKCVRPKELYEACVSNQECSFKNPNVQCVNFLCNCSQPFQLSPRRLCQLPPSPDGNIFPTAITVMLVLALLVAAGGYAYQKMLRERERSSSLSAKAGLSLQADTSSTSSTARMLGGGWPWGRRHEYREGEFDPLEETDEPRRLRTQSEISLPRHPPRYISRKGSSRRVTGLSTVHECCSKAERSSSLSQSECASMEEPDKRDTPLLLLHRTPERRDLVYQQKREIEAQPGGSAYSRSSPVHMLLPKDDQMRKILNDDQEIVVTIETGKGRHHLLTTPSLPPVFSLPRREPPPFESTTTDDSFMKDLKRRRGRLGGRHGADLSTHVTTSTLRSTSAGVTTTHPSDAGVLASVHKAQQVDGLPTMRGVFGLSAPPCGFPTSTQPAKQRNFTIEPAPKPTSNMAVNVPSSNVVEKANVPTQTSTAPGTRDRRPGNDESEDRSMRGTYDTIKSRSSTVPVTSPLTSPEIRLQSAERSEQNAKGRCAEQGNVSMKTVLGATVLHNSTKDEGQKQLCVLDDLDILAACARSTEKTHMAKQKTEAPTGPSSASVTGSPPTACPKTDAVAEVHTSEARNVIEKSDEGHIDLRTPVASTNVSESRTSCYTAKHSPAGRFLCSEKSEIVQSEQINIAQVGEIASQLLLGIVELHGEEARASSLDGNVNRGLHCVSRLEADTPGRPCGAARPSPVIVCSNEERTEPTVEERVGVITSDVKHDAKLGKHRPPTKFNYSSSDEPRDYASENYVSENTRASNANSAAPFGVLKSSKANSRPTRGAAGQFKPRETAWPSGVEIIDDTSSEMWPQGKFAPALPSPPAYGLNQKVADDVNLSSSRTGEKRSHQATHSVLEERHASVFNGGAQATEKELKFGAAREPGESTVEMRNNSPSFAEAGGLRRAWRRRASVSSVFSETTPSLSFQKPYQELMTKISQHPVRFTERPFADVLASLESEITSIVKDEQRVDVPDEKEKTPSEPKLPDTGGQPGSRRSDTDDGNLDETALRSFSADDEENDFEADAATDEAVETCTSADSAKLPSRHCPASSGPAMKRAATATTLESEGAFKPKALLDHSASDKDSTPPSKSLSLTFGSSNTSCNTSNHPSNPDELRRSEQSVMAVAEAAACKTGNGVDPSTNLQVTASSVTRTENLQRPTSLKSDISAQTQLPVPGTSLRPHLSNHQSRMATDRPWTEDVEKVVTLGNEHYIQQRAALQCAAKSATRFDETQWLLFHIEDPKQLAMSVRSQQPTLGSLNPLSGELAQGSHEFVQGARNHRGAASSSRDIERHEPQAACFQPLKLKDLTARKVSDADLKRVLTIRLSKASNVPPLRTLCSQVLLPAETPADKYAAPAERNVNTPSCPSCARLEASATATASPNDPPSKKRGPKARLSLDALSEKAATAALEEEEALSDTQLQQRRRGRSQSVVITGVSHEWSDQGPSPSKKAKAAAATRTAKGPIRFIGPPASQNIVVLPDSSVAIRLPEGARSADLWAPASGTSLRQGSAATGLVVRNRHLLLASALEDPSFESIYNAILQAAPPTENALEASGPGDVPCRPARRASSPSRAVSFDNSPTVVPLEPPPEPFAERDVSTTAVDAEPVATPPPFHRPRRRSSLCRSSSGSLLQEVTETADLLALLGTRRPSCQLPSFLVEPSSTRDDAASSAKDAAGPETTLSGGAAAPIQEQHSPLTSPFYSFEDTMSELSSLPDANSSGSFPASQRSERAGSRDQTRGSLA